MSAISQASLEAHAFAILLSLRRYGMEAFDKLEAIRLAEALDGNPLYGQLLARIKDDAPQILADPAFMEE